MSDMPKEKQRSIIVWFREDLRLADNPALHLAKETGAPVVPLFILDEESDGLRAFGGAQRWWLHHSLASLGSDLARLGTGLILRRGRAFDVLTDVIRETGASSVHWNRRYDAGGIEVDRTIKAALGDRGIEIHSFAGQLLCEPARLETKAGGPYKVYTPFWRAVGAREEPREPLPAPRRLTAPETFPASEKLESWNCCPGSPIGRRA